MKFDIKNLSDNAIELYLYGEIVADELSSWSFDDQYPSAVRDFLNENKGKEVHVRINSPGGSCFAGICIGEMLKQHDGKTVSHVDGLAGSIATYIACCCDEIRVHNASYFMVHNAWVCASGNKNDLRETIDLLDKMDNTIAEAYMKHTNKSIDEIKEMMNNETWMCGAEILDTFNFILDEEEKVEAYAKIDFNYKNIPSELLAQLEEAKDEEVDNEVEDGCKKKDEKDICKKEEKKCQVLKCPECDYEGEMEQDEEGYYICPECDAKFKLEEQEEPDTDDDDMEDGCKKKPEDECKKEKEKCQAEAKKELEFIKAKMFLENYK